VLSVLRTAFDRAAVDPKFVETSIAANGVPYGPIGVERGRAIIGSLTQVSPAVLKALRTSMGIAN
jgi:hypothetical protein